MFAPFRPARRLATVALLACFALIPSPALAQITFEGTLSIVWSDPRSPGAPGGGVRYVLETDEGRYVTVETGASANTMLPYRGHRVVISGHTAATPAAAGTEGGDVIVAESIADDPRFAAPAAALEVAGSRRMLFLLLQFSDDKSLAHAPDFYLYLTNPDNAATHIGIPATLNAFFKRTSNTKFWWVAAAKGNGLGPIALPHEKSYYAPCGWEGNCFDVSAFNADAIAVAKAQRIDFTLYDTINFVVSNDLDCCSYAGNVSIDGASYGATWAPPWAQDTLVYAQMLGHTLGLPNSGWVYYAFDSPWDVMSAYTDAAILDCGEYFSRNSGTKQTLWCREPGNGYIMAHRDVLGWLNPQFNVATSDTIAGTTVTLEAAALPVGLGLKMLKICLPGWSCVGTGPDTRYFTVEARVKNGGLMTQYDNGIPNEGIIIHDVWFGRPAISGRCFSTDGFVWAVPVDATPGDFDPSTCTRPQGGGLDNAAFVAGTTYRNELYKFQVSVVSRAGYNFLVTVKSLRGTFTTEVGIDAPANGATVSRPFSLEGWAVNGNATSGTGVSAVHVYAAPSGGTPILLGAATYGGARSDLAARLGPEFTNSGWTLSNVGGSLAAGTYAITAYARNAMTGTFDATATANITVTTPVSHPGIAVDAPMPTDVVTSAFEVGGWALDSGASSGTGVDSVQFYVQPQGAPAPGVFIGTGSYGWARSDLASIYGARFTNCGFHFTITGMSPGSFTLHVYAHSTVTGSYSILQSVPFTVSATALMSIDAPSPEATITANTFLVGGWSIDRGVESTAQAGSGVNTLHVYAYPNPGSNQPPIFLGVASVGVSRPDVGAAYGSRYTSSGYQLIVDRNALGLAPGVYNIAVHSRSSVSGTFNNDAVVRVTLQ